MIPTMADDVTALGGGRRRLQAAAAAPMKPLPPPVAMTPHAPNTQMTLEERQKKESQQETVADPNSKRSGPQYVAPYTPRQLQDMINMLTQLMERYRDQQSITPIIVRYIDEVARRGGGPPEDEIA